MITDIISLQEQLETNRKLGDYHRSEIDRLTEVCNGRMAWGTKLTAAEAEIERLRAALQEIAKQHKSDEWEQEGDTEGGYDAIIDLARAALANG